MYEIKIKDKWGNWIGITPYTPTAHTRIFERNKFPEQIAYLPTWPTVLPTPKNLVINKRVCEIINYNNFIIAYPIDEPKQKRLRIYEEKADIIFFQFCRNQDWEYLFNAYKNSYSKYFKKQIIRRVTELTRDIKNCDTCPIKFKCYTEK